MEHLQSFIAECDRKTELAKRRLKETQEELSEEANAKVKVVLARSPQICICKFGSIFPFFRDKDLFKGVTFGGTFSVFFALLGVHLNY